MVHVHYENKSEEILKRKGLHISRGSISLTHAVQAIVHVQCYASDGTRQRRKQEACSGTDIVCVVI